MHIAVTEIIDPKKKDFEFSASCLHRHTTKGLVSGWLGSQFIFISSGHHQSLLFPFAFTLYIYRIYTTQQKLQFVRSSTAHYANICIPWWCIGKRQGDNQVFPRNVGLTLPLGLISVFCLIILRSMPSPLMYNYVGIATTVSALCAL